MINQKRFLLSVWILYENIRAAFFFFFFFCSELNICRPVGMCPHFSGPASERWVSEAFCLLTADDYWAHFEIALIIHFICGHHPNDDQWFIFLKFLSDISKLSWWMRIRKRYWKKIHKDICVLRYIWFSFDSRQIFKLFRHTIMCVYIYTHIQK